MRAPLVLRIAGALLTVGIVVACGDDGGGDVAAFCEAVGDHEELDAVFAGLEPTDTEDARARFREARDTQARLRDLAPEAARGDLDIVIAFVDDLIAGLSPGQDVDEHGRPAIYQSLRPRFDEVEAAGERLRVYVDSNC